MSGNEKDNKIVSSTDCPMPTEANNEFTDRPVHMKNIPESWGMTQEKQGLYESGM